MGDNKKQERPKSTVEQQEQWFEEMMEEVPEAKQLALTWKLCTLLWKSGQFYHAKSPAGILSIILYGRELGLGPMQSLMNIDIIDGKPGMSTQLMLAKAERAGVRIEALERTDKVARLRITYGQKPPDEFEFTIQDATTAKLAGGSKDNWNKYPRHMLWWRCVAEAVDAYAPGILLRSQSFDELSAGAAKNMLEMIDNHEDIEKTVHEGEEVGAEVVSRSDSIADELDAQQTDKPAPEKTDEDKAAEESQRQEFWNTHCDGCQTPLEDGDSDLCKKCRDELHSPAPEPPEKPVDQGEEIRRELLADIDQIESHKDFGPMRPIDMRLKYGGLAELHKMSVDGLTAYRDFLKTLPDKTPATKSKTYGDF